MGSWVLRGWAGGCLGGTTTADHYFTESGSDQCKMAALIMGYLSFISVQWEEVGTCRPSLFLKDPSLKKTLLLFDIVNLKIDL